jgi:hypothetical protein
MQQRLDQEDVSRDGQVQARRLTLRMEQERRNVGILLEPLHDAFLLALAVDSLEADVADAVAREGLHEEAERFLPVGKDDDLGVRIATADVPVERVRVSIRACSKENRRSTPRLT